MKKIRCILFGAVVAFSSTTLALGGEIQDPGRSDPPPPPPPASVTASTTAGEIQVVLHDIATEMLSQVLLTIF